MDIPIKRKHPIIRYKYYITGATFLAILVIWIIILSGGPEKLKIDTENIHIEQVQNGKFVEYLDTEGTVQPILTIKINTQESGSVKKIISEEGSMLQKGDTILTLDNPELLRSIEDQNDEWEKQKMSYNEKMIEMEQSSLTLKRQMLESIYELDRLKKSYQLDKEEFQMGIKSKAQLEVSQDEYNHKIKKTALQLKSLEQDSVMTIIRKKLMKNDLEREQKKYQRSYERMEKLIVRAPVNGQLSFIKVTPGQQVVAGESLAEIKVLTKFKIHTALNEFYIDRITNGLPATINYQNKKYPLKITKVVPEVKDRTFDVDLVFTGNLPENIRIGKSFRIQIELGQPEKALVIPRGNFFQSTGGQWIYKLNKARTKAYKVPVNIGRQNPQQYEITGGLNAGDYIITTGYDNFGDAEELILK